MRACADSPLRPPSERAGLPAKAAGRCLYRVAAARKALEGNANTKLVLTNLGIRLARANR